jgi:hypothetical protein
MLGNITRLALAISIAAGVLTAGTIYQPSAYDDVSNVGFSAGNSAGISFVGTDTSVPSNGVSWVSYWVFDLPTGTGPITSATFDLTPHEFFGDNSTETVNFTAFALSPSILTTAYAPNNLTGISIYDSVLSGTPFGQLSVQPSDALLDCQVVPCASQPGNLLSFQFNSTGLADINADLGGVFVIGAYLSPSSSIPTYDAVGVQFNFLNFAGPVSQLDLTSVPEPNSASLFAIAGFAALVFRRIRR